LRTSDDGATDRLIRWLARARNPLICSRPITTSGSASVNWKGLIIAAASALFIAFLGAYLLVVSQNPASAVSGPQFEYGAPQNP
jgi:hypothetical protein